MKKDIDLTNFTNSQKKKRSEKKTLADLNLMTYQMEK